VLRYGIPEFKLEKRVLDRRLALLEEEGVVFRTGVNVGVDVPTTDLQHHYDAVLLAGGAERPRELPLPGRDATGIVQAMTYLTSQNERCESPERAVDAALSAAGRHVVIIGGGDTGADCVGTAHRQGAASVTQLERMPMPPARRAADNPWPLWPHVFRTSTAHEEGGTRTYAIDTTAFLTDESGRVRALRAQQLDPSPDGHAGTFVARPESVHEIPADLVILALGFSGPTGSPLIDALGVARTATGTIARDDEWRTSVPGIYVAGDMQRGASLIVWAIDDGRRAAAAIDRDLMQRT
jgi:glutamate synthase (NADPH/NADH) small chain